MALVIILITHRFHNFCWNFKAAKLWHSRSRSFSLWLRNNVQLKNFNKMQRVTFFSDRNKFYLFVPRADLSLDIQVRKWKLLTQEKLCHMPVGSVPKEGTGRPHRFRRHRHPYTAPMHLRHHHHHFDWLFWQDSNSQSLRDFQNCSFLLKFLKIEISSCRPCPVLIESLPLHPSILPPKLITEACPRDRFRSTPRRLHHSTYKSSPTQLTCEQTKT